MKYLGCAYYPEYWGEARVEIDARLMREASINSVRIGEFAWSRMESRLGHFTLDWLHKAIETLGRHGIEVIVCTPTATPPAWLTENDPQVLLVGASGKRMEHGTRRHYCCTNPIYREHCRRIAGELSRSLASHRNVMAWQIDNELGPESGWCYCENCQARFQQWLAQRYGSLEELNNHWGTAFWSNDYSDWHQVRLGDDAADHFASRRLDTKRFFSDMMIEFGLEQAKVLRQNHPGAIITTNGMGPLYAPVDYYKLNAGLDVACDDLYFDIATMEASAAAMDAYRSYKPEKSFWITETGSGALDHNKPPHAAQLRAWAWSGIARGADGWWIFRWRTCLSGQEQELQGMLEHSGRPGRRYQAVKAMYDEIARHRPELARLPLPKANVAILSEYDLYWAYEASRIGKAVAYPVQVLNLHRFFHDRNIVCDFVPFAGDFAAYKLLVLPSPVILPLPVLQAVQEFADRGGIVFITGQAAMRDENDNYHRDGQPDEVTRLLGCVVDGGMYLLSHVAADEALWAPATHERTTMVAMDGMVGGKAISGSANTWIADLRATTGEVLLTYCSDAYSGQPAVLETKIGAGWVIYAAALGMDDALLGALLDQALSRAQIQPEHQSPHNVEVIRRADWVFVINHTAEPVTVDLGSRSQALIGSIEVTIARLEPYGVCVARDAG